LSTITTYQNINQDAYLLFLMGVSFFGLFLVGILTINPPVAESLPWRKPVIGSVFGSICVLGSLAALFPKNCLGVFHLKKEDALVKKKFHSSQESDMTSYKVRFAVRGHHPDCGNFSGHVFRVGNRTFCTSCTGLLLGALINLIATFLYFFGAWQLSQKSLPTVYFGILGISFGLLQFPLFKNRKSPLRFLLNSFFVLGAFLILVEIDTLVQSVVTDLFLILLIVFWIFTRISLSQWDHKRICYACNVEMCEFFI
jgi:hypothetical protein